MFENNELLEESSFGIYFFSEILQLNHMNMIAEDAFWINALFGCPKLNQSQTRPYLKSNLVFICYFIFCPLTRGSLALHVRKSHCSRFVFKMLLLVEARNHYATVLNKKHVQQGTEWLELPVSNPITLFFITSLFRTYSANSWITHKAKRQHSLVFKGILNYYYYYY